MGGTRRKAGLSALLMALAAVSCWAVVAWAGDGAGGRDARLVPPPEPEVRPQIVRPTDMDANDDRLDDVLMARLRDILAMASAEPDADRRAALVSKLDEFVGVELVFRQQVTQAQIDGFLAIGGRIDRVFRAVSYGWNGSIPIGRLEQIPSAMGDTLLGAIRIMPLVRHLDDATRTGRVRPIWVSGFAGGFGFSGSSATRIAILDTGVDDSHPDLAGRNVYWHDYSVSAEPNPVDFGGHGTHVAGIATGTGAAMGAASTVLQWTDSGNLDGVLAGYFFPSSVSATTPSTVLTANAAWNGGGNTVMRWMSRPRASTGPWTTVGSTASGASPRLIVESFAGDPALNYTSALISNGAMGRYAIINSMTTERIDDGFNQLRGVAPGCRWVGMKIFDNDGAGTTAEINAAMDDLVILRSALQIKVANLSAGIDTTNSTLRAKANTVVNNGIVFCVSAGNSGSTGVITDPARASQVVTVGSASDVNALTAYTSIGLTAPGSTEDVKPDVLAPGGSGYESLMMSADSNDSDAEAAAFADRRADDYTNLKGTSMASPFAAGCAALIVQALESSGVTWSWSSSSTSLLVKVLMCASCTETVQDREDGVNNPTLGRGGTPHDRFEGYGMLNPDAACEAACMTAPWAAEFTGYSAGGERDRRAWGRRIAVSSGYQVTLNLAVGLTADYDLYLYSSTPDAKGTPQLLDYSCAALRGADEQIIYTPTYSGTAYVFIKRVRGSGSFTFTPYRASASMITVTAPNGGEQWQLGSTHAVTWTYSGSSSRYVDLELYKSGAYVRDIRASADGAGSYSWTIPTDLAAGSGHKVRVASTSTVAADISDAGFSLVKAGTTLTADAKSAQIGDTVSLTATLRRTDNGAALAGQSVTFAVSGTAVGSATTAASGIASVAYAIPEALGVGTVTTTADFAGTAVYAASSGQSSLTTSRADTTMTVLDRSGVITTAALLRAYLYRANGSVPLSAKTVEFRVDGSPVGSAATDSSGRASLSWTIDCTPGNHVLSGLFSGTELYNPVSDNAVLLASVVTTKVYVPARTGAIKQDAVVRAYLFDLSNAPIYGKDVSVLVDGTLVGAKATDSTGRVQFYYTVPEGAGSGSRQIRGEFAGNAGYTASAGNGVLTVVQGDLYLWVYVRSGKTGTSHPLKTYVRCLPDYVVQPGKLILFRVNGTDIGSAPSAASGWAIVTWAIPIGEPPGAHAATAVFAGDAWYNAQTKDAAFNVVP